MSKTEAVQGPDRDGESLLLASDGRDKKSNAPEKTKTLTRRDFNQPKSGRIIGAKRRRGQSRVEETQGLIDWRVTTVLAKRASS